MIGQILRGVWVVLRCLLGDVSSCLGKLWGYMARGLTKFGDGLVWLWNEVLFPCLKWIWAAFRGCLNWVWERIWNDALPLIDTNHG